MHIHQSQRESQPQGQLKFKSFRAGRKPRTGRSILVFLAKALKVGDSSSIEILKQSIVGAFTATKTIVRFVNSFSSEPAGKNCCN